MADTLVQAIISVLRLYSANPSSPSRSRTDAAATVTSIINDATSLYNKVNDTVITFWTVILATGVLAAAYFLRGKKKASPRTAVATRATRATGGQGQRGALISHVLPDTPSVRDFVSKYYNRGSKASNASSSG